jgi:hypothetical protein
MATNRRDAPAREARSFTTKNFFWGTGVFLPKKLPHNWYALVWGRSAVNGITPKLTGAEHLDRPEKLPLRRNTAQPIGADGTKRTVLERVTQNVICLQDWQKPTSKHIYLLVVPRLEGIQLRPR